jgi:type II secretory pathway pseudopilin PulG
MSFTRRSGPRRSRVTRDGFMLLEAVIALVIIALFGVGLLATMGAQVRTADRGVVLLTGRALAEDRFMAIQMLGNEEIKDFPDSLAAGVFPEPFEDFTWTATVEPVGEEYDLFATSITVSAFGYSFVEKSMLHRPRPAIQAQ